jgi:hypothetical protein
VGGHEPGIGEDVVAEEQDDRGAGGLPAGVALSGRAAGGVQQACARRAPEVDRLAGRRDDEDLADARLVGDPVQAAAQQLGAVVGRDDDAQLDGARD